MMQGGSKTSKYIDSKHTKQQSTHHATIPQNNNPN